MSNLAGWKNILESLWCRYNSVPLRGTQLSILRFWPLLCVVDVQNISCKFVKLRLLYKVKRYFILYKMTCVPAFNLRTIPVMNFIPVFNYYATFRVKLVMVFIQDICDISKISKNCNCDIWMGRSTGNNGFIIFMHIHEMSCSDLRFNFKVNQVVFIINK